MTDNLKKHRPQDARRINIHEPWEVNWWCYELKVGCAREATSSKKEKVGSQKHSFESTLFLNH